MLLRLVCACAFGCVPMCVSGCLLSHTHTHTHYVEARRQLDALCVENKVDCSEPRTVSRLIDKVCGYVRGAGAVQCAEER